MDLFLEERTLGAWQANCYVLGDRDAGRAVVVDPGQDAAPVVRRILAEHGVACDAVLLTHGHLDHVWSAPRLASDLDAPVLLSADDLWLWNDPLAIFPDSARRQIAAQLDLRWDPGAPPDPLSDGQRLDVGGVSLEVRSTPGHTPGSCVFLLDGETPLGDAPAGLLLSGDLLFAGSVGRTDFPRGSTEQLLRSIAERVLDLPDATTVAPGHGPRTTVGSERRSNPFLQAVAGGP